MNRRLIVFLLLLLVVIAGGAGWGVQHFAKRNPKPLRSETVDRGTVEVKVTETGTIEALKKVEVKSKVAGRIDKLHVQEGSRVTAGQLLAEIDPTEINSQVEQIRAQLDATRARYEQARRAVHYQEAQTIAAIRQNREALLAAEARLEVVEEENRLQPRLYESELAQARAALKTARDSLTLLKEVTHPQAVVQSRSACEEAKAQQETSRRRMEREKQLLAQGFAARQDFETSQSDLAAAKARFEQAKSRLDLVEQQNRLEAANAESRVAESSAALDRALANQSLVTIRRQDVLSARAAVEQARAQLNAALAGPQQDRMRQDELTAAKAGVKQLDQQLREVEVRQRDTRLTASMAGVVTRRYIEQGELVTSGVSTFSSGTPVIQIADLSVMLVKMSVNEVDVHQVRVGRPVEITIDGVRDVVFRGHVTQVAPAAIGSTGAGQEGGGQSQATGRGDGSVVRFAVTVQVDRADPRLKPGMGARCSIVIARREKVLRVPLACVEGKGERASVEVVVSETRGGKAVETTHRRKVQVGLRGDSHAEIVSGLERRERVKPAAFTGPRRRGMGGNLEID